MNSSRTFPKALLIILALVVAVFFVSTQPAQAQVGCVGPGCPPGGTGIGDIIDAILNIPLKVAEVLIGIIADLINNLILLIAKLFFWLANLLIGIALDSNNNLALGKESIVNAGHKIVLGIANMGFIVALAVIAFATMLRWEGFNYKKALPRVIIAALLINFGFFIVTHWLISPVNQITEAFRASSNFSPENSFAFFNETDGIKKAIDAFTNPGGSTDTALNIAKIL